MRTPGSVNWKQSESGARLRTPETRPHCFPPACDNLVSIWAMETRDSVMQLALYRRQKIVCGKVRVIEQGALTAPGPRRVVSQPFRGAGPRRCLITGAIRMQGAARGFTQSQAAHVRYRRRCPSLA